MQEADLAGEGSTAPGGSVRRPALPARPARTAGGRLAAVVVLGALIGSALGACSTGGSPSSSSPERSAATTTTADRKTRGSLCSALGASPGDVVTGVPDVGVYLDHDATDAQRDEVARALQADDRVAFATYRGPEEAYQDFLLLFADDQTMLDNVGLGDLPTVFEVHVARGDDAPAVARDLRASDLTGIYTVSEYAGGRPTVLDGLVWPGRDPEARADASRLGELLYGPAWPRKARRVVDAARAGGDDELAEAAEALAAAIASRPGTPRAPNGPIPRDLAIAAAVVESSGGECGIATLELFTTRSSRSASMRPGSGGN